MRVIIYSNKKTRDIECFSSLKPLFEKYPLVKAKKHSIYAYTSRQKNRMKTTILKCKGLKCNNN